MAKQYYSQEEAAQALGVSSEQINEMRERGDVRAFSDRGAWKFQVKQIDDLAKQRSAAIAEDSDQVLLFDGELGPGDSGPPSTVIGMDSSGAPSDSDVRLLLDEPAGGGSDSDVKLMLDLPRGSDSDVKLVESGSPASDSDVRIDDLLGDPLATRRTTEALDADAASLPSQPKKATDTPPWDSDLVLGAVSDSDIGVAQEDSGISLTKPGDSGISLEQPPDVNVVAEAGEELLETDFEVPVLDQAAIGAADLEMDSDFELTPVEDRETQIIALEGEEVDASAATAIAESGVIEESEEVAVAEVEEVAEAAMPVAMGAAGRMVRAQETEWGTMVNVMLMATAAMLLLAFFMTFDLTRNLWGSEFVPGEKAPSAITGWVFGVIKSITG